VAGHQGISQVSPLLLMLRELQSESGTHICDKYRMICSKSRIACSEYTGSNGTLNLDLPWE
jgi:hypothetical protein